MPITRGPKAVKKREGKRPSMQCYLRCLHCGRNQSRHLSTGTGSWGCRYCTDEEGRPSLNPGPAVSEKVIAVRKTSAPRSGVGEPAQPPAGEDPAPARAKRVTRGSPNATGARRPERRADVDTPPAPVLKSAPGDGAAAAAGTEGTAPTPTPKRSLWDRIAYGS